MFPQPFVKAVKDTSMLELAKRYTTLKKVGDGIWQGKCPHPKHNDSTPSFVVWEKTNSWACMGCHNGKKGQANFGSDTIAFIQWVEGLKWREAVLKVAEINDMQKPSEENDKLYKRNKQLTQKYVKDLNEEAYNYLLSRGLSDQDMRDWLLGYDKFEDRIVFPLMDKYKNIVGFNKRLLVVPPDSGYKYKNSATSKIFNKSKYLYGIHNLDPSFPYIRITEGSMDVILAHKYGLKNIVASLGTSFTEEHVQVVKKLGLTPVLIFDGDDAGDTALQKVMGYFAKEDIYCKIVKLPKGKDLADIALEYKTFLEDYISSESITYGYSKIKSIVDEYNKELYELKLKMYPKVQKILDIVPEAEKAALKSYLLDEIKIKV